MRECDSKAVQRVKVFVDTREGALAEAGDLCQPMAEGVFEPADIQADLFQLVGGEHPGRQNDLDITLFKSVGASLEDLAAAELVMENAGR